MTCAAIYWQPHLNTHWSIGNKNNPYCKQNHQIKSSYMLALIKMYFGYPLNISKSSGMYLCSNNEIWRELCMILLGWFYPACPFTLPQNNYLLVFTHEELLWEVTIVYNQSLGQGSWMLGNREREREREGGSFSHPPIFRRDQCLQAKIMNMDNMFSCTDRFTARGQ